MGAEGHTPPTGPDAAPGRRRVQLREVPFWEYMTAYDMKFQIRMPDELYRRLVELAQREGKTLDDLVVALLEEEAGRRAANGR